MTAVELMRRIIWSLAKFVTALFLMTIVFTIVWQFLGQTLYDCTDDNMAGFLRPGDWVHNPIVTVHQIVHGRSMSAADTLKEGWSVTGLWCLWSSFVLASLLISLWFALPGSNGPESGCREDCPPGPHTT
jgi:hypothetical protein